MRTYKIALISGDGIGPEVLKQGVKVLRAAQECEKTFKLDMKEYEVGALVYRKYGTAFPEETNLGCKNSDAIFLGAIGLPDVIYPDGTEVGPDAVMGFRKQYRLYINIRPIKLCPGIDSVLRNRKPGMIDYIILRENMEGLYAGRGGGNILLDQVATDTMIITRKQTARIVNFAFELARKTKGAPRDARRRVTCVDKSNVLRSYGFFRKIFKGIGGNYADVEKDYAYVDAMTQWMLLKPDFYNVIVTENMFGDILSDLGGATIGGIGMVPSAEIGDELGLFQGIHGSAPDIAGRGIANPIATILSGKMMLEWLGEKYQDEALLQSANKIEKAVTMVPRERKIRTPDIRGASQTCEVGDAIAEKITDMKNKVPPNCFWNM